MAEDAKSTTPVGISGLLKQRRFWYVVLAALIIFFAVFPFWASGYWVRVFTSVFMYAAMATSLNIILGYTGYADFGNVVFFGVGAYTTGVLMTLLSVPLPLAILAGGLLSALYATLLGLPILRLRGHYFAIATIGVMDATREIISNMDPITGGGTGLSLPLPDLGPEQFFTAIYFTMFGLMIIYMALSALIRRSRFGYGLRAIRADEEAAAIAGIPTTRYKVMAWATSAFMTGIVGGVFAYWFSYIEPPDVFNIMTAVKYMIMVLLGGVGTVFGPVIGAFFLELISELVWGQFLELHLGVLGFIIIVVVIFIPKGIMALARGGFKPRAWLAELRQNKI
jgi:branched-chain amino acid transport system permease protein